MTYAMIANNVDNSRTNRFPNVILSSTPENGLTNGLLMSYTKSITMFVPFAPRSRRTKRRSKMHAEIPKIILMNFTIVSMMCSDKMIVSEKL